MVRALLLPDYYLVTVMLSGIKVRFGRCPLPADRACCHLGALGTGSGLRGASPTPSAPPAIGCPLAPCLAQPPGCAHRCGAVTAGWGHLGSAGTSSVAVTLGDAQGGMAPSHQEGSAPV